MQMNGVAELITISRLWRSWDDPRFVVLVLHNRELAEVTWEQREMEGEPRFEDSQALPDFPYARYAELLGLTGIKVDHPGDADVPLLPSFPAGEQKLESFRRGLEHEGAAGEHALNLLDEQAAQERLIT